MTDRRPPTLTDHLAAHRIVDRHRHICSCGQHFVFLVNQTIDDARDAHVAATWREARTITTVEQLDALPVGATVQEETHDHTWIKHSDNWHCSCDGTDIEWTAAGLADECGFDLIVTWQPADEGSAS